MSSVENFIGFGVPRAEARSVHCEDGSALRYWVAGHGERPLVCVNAHGQDLLVMAQLASALAPRWRVIAWKPRGTFEPSGPVATLWEQVRDLTRILANEQVSECALITWCAGAKVAMEFARRSPAVRALVLTNGTFTRIPGLEAHETQFEQTLWELCRAVVRTPALADMMKSSMRALLGGASSQGARPGNDSAGTQDAALQALIGEPFLSTESTLRYAAQVVDYLSHDITPCLSELGMPTLVLSGEHDRVSSPLMARAVAERLPRAWFAQIPSGSHYCLYERRDESARVIEEFLAGALGATKAESPRVSLGEVAP